MASYQPILAGQTLPYPTSYKIASIVDGGAEQAINGAVKLSVVNSANRLRFTLTWQLLTSAADRDALLAAWDALRSTSASFTDVMGDTYTVTRDPGMEELELDFQPIRSPWDWAFDAEITLLQVLGTD